MGLELLIRVGDALETPDRVGDLLIRIDDGFGTHD
jgi:hypothetical protein